MKYISFIAIAVLFFSCSRNPLKVNVSNIDLNVAVVRFDQLLFQTDTAQLEHTLSAFYQENQVFTDIYTGSLLKIGVVGEPQMLPLLKQFITDTVYAKVAAEELNKFSDLSEIEAQITKGFKHYKYYFPYDTVPKIYGHFSGFNQAVFTADNCIGIGLDKYLGSDCIYYTYLGIPKYKAYNMHPEKIVADLFYSFAFSKYDNLDSIDNLLSNMIYLGKLHYFTEAMCPAMNDSLNIGFSEQQLKWCQKHEAQMWTYLIENKLIYSAERLTLQKYLGDAPFTNSFSEESPGRTGVWLGWQIVRSFMKNNKEVTLPQLMKMNNAQLLLSQSKYNPN
jgi:hypothetical protein